MSRRRSSAAQRRITKEWAEIQADFPPNVEVSPDENNLFHWTGVLTGPDESAYKGGKFKIDITFPNEVSTDELSTPPAPVRALARAGKVGNWTDTGRI